MKVESLKDCLKKMLSDNGIQWNSGKGIYSTRLHKDFYLRESEAKSVEHFEEFCKLVKYLEGHLEFGVSIEWGDSELNRYVYELNKDELRNQFPLTINALARFYADSDIIAFYKKTLRAEDPTIIDLVGTTGAGKTTFCQQFVNDEGKSILEKTITPSGNSTIIQTDIVILENTKNRLFLKARGRKDVIRDILLVCLSVESDYKFELKKGITEGDNKKGIKKSVEKDIKVDGDLFQGVYNLFRTEELMEQFMSIAKIVQENLKSEEDIQDYLNDNMDNSDIVQLLDTIIKKELNIENFYGYRHEMNLEEKYILEKTVIPTKVFNKNKEKNVEFENIISYRILFEQAVLVLKCDEKAKSRLPKKFRKGVVFRDSQGHKKSEQVGIATDFEVKNKILLIPANTGGELVDDRYIDELKNIITSEPKQNVIVITKLDKASSYEYYKEDYDDFIENLKEQVVTTHNNLIGRLEDEDGENADATYRFDRNAIVKKFIESFDNAFLSKVTKGVDGSFDPELHRIICQNKNNQEISKSDIEDIKAMESWYDLVSGILERQSGISYEEGGLVYKCANANEKTGTISTLISDMDGMLKVAYKNINWQNKIHKALSLYSRDFRSIYNELYLWKYRSFNRDNSVSGYNIEDKVSEFVKYIHSLVLKSDNSKNAVEEILEATLITYLEECYSFEKNLSAAKIAKKIISNAISRASIISYKLFDRDVINYTSSQNIRSIYQNTQQCTIPKQSINYYEVFKRTYYTDTASNLGIYCKLCAKYKYNIETYFIDIFKTVIEIELEKLEKNAK